MDALKSKGQMYDQINLGSVQKSGFDISFFNKGTGKIGQLIPTRCQEVIPGDSFTGNSTASVQFEPLAVPILANMDVRQEHFYVPNRILWSNWEKFITGGEQMNDTSTPPAITLNTILTAIKSTFGMTGYDSIGYISVYKGSDNVYYADFPDNGTWLTTANSYISGIISYSQGDSVKMYDILLPMINAIYDYIDLVKAKRGTSKHIKLFADTQMVWNSTLKDCTNKAELNGINSELTTAIRQYAGVYSSQIAGNKTNVFSDEFLEILQGIYDIIKIYFGTGSMLDYMNAPRLKFADFVVDYYSQVYKVINGYSANGTNKMEFGNALSSISINFLPFRSHYLIWYNYYRDQLLESGVYEPSTKDIVTSPEIIAVLAPRQRCWRKDTFTTALANTGTGSMVVPVSPKPFVEGANAGRLYSIGNQLDSSSASLQDMDLKNMKLTDGTVLEFPSRWLNGLTSNDENDTSGEGYDGFSLDMLNRAQRMQKWLMKNLIYGNRIQDSLYTHFGVKSSDARLDLPEYIAGSRTLVRLDTIVNNTTVGQTVAGDKAANAYGYDDGDKIDKFCEEHGFLISYLTIMPEPTYSYSMSRLYNKTDKFDYAWPELSQIGMDAVYNSELLCPAIGGFDNVSSAVFGYQGRYYDYKSKQDEEHGELQTTQNMYTFSREFSPYDKDSLPKLNYVFVHCWPSLDMFVVDDKNSDYFRYDIHHSMGVSRVLPVCGTNL